MSLVYSKRLTSVNVFFPWLLKTFKTFLRVVTKNLPTHLTFNNTMLGFLRSTMQRLRENPAAHSTQEQSQKQKYCGFQKYSCPANILSQYEHKQIHLIEICWKTNTKLHTIVKWNKTYITFTFRATIRPCTSGLYGRAARRRPALKLLFSSQKLPVWQTLRLHYLLTLTVVCSSIYRAWSLSVLVVVSAGYT